MAPSILVFLIKSFAGVQGVVFQKNPLAAGGKGDQDGQAKRFLS
jgi:hypothetical protein